jgi:uncharacterized linocin/CFP29 family protein
MTITQATTGSIASKLKQIGGYLPVARENPDGTQELVVNEYGLVQLTDGNTYPDGRPVIVANSLLRKDEWEMLDDAVQIAATGEYNAIPRLNGDPQLRKQLNSAGILVAQYNQGSEMSRAAVSLSGRAAPDFDRQDYNLTGVPVPVIHKEFQIGYRELEASRLYGSGVDTTNAFEASRVVSEELERLWVAGNTNIALNQDILYGVTNEPNINTGAATGDFGTLSNIVPTFRNMIIALAGDNYFGNYEFWVARTQYNEMALNFHSDGTGDSGLTRVLKMPNITAIYPSDWMTAGTLVGIQMTPNVLDFCIHQLNQVIEWTSPDGMAQNFKVMSICAVRVKSDYNSNSGVVYYTGA